ncbi:30S ribosomal protein S3 [Candidatus Dojkabacteria bacterium]|uniref:Small ribosomal subunit protein uS3 n=1 Tax=Candidatus Dojkabacteria bacterium TaxID=2099670 RepID=A0A955I5N6_9BACT|nr:30S ribosomal protein S3 [Candidatus Dojkabacteria bacterium]
MGNKSNTTALRIGVNKNWKSIWYRPNSTYADTFLQDIKIRKLIEKEMKNAGVAEIIVKRTVSKVLVEVMVARPGVVIGRGGAGIEALQKQLKNLTKTDVEVKVYEVKRPEIEAKLVAENIASQCERRISPKIAMRRAAEAAMDTGLVKGITVIVAGRIRGAEIARSEKIELGTVPRHTLRADIDYALVEAQVPGAGKHGIKVWINKGEKSTYSVEK